MAHCLQKRTPFLNNMTPTKTINIFLIYVSIIEMEKSGRCHASSEIFACLLACDFVWKRFTRINHVTVVSKEIYH